MTGSRPDAADASPEELVRRAADGDLAAFARIVRLHSENMTRVAFVVTGDLDVAARAAGAAWPVAWSGLRGRRSQEGLGPWLCSLAAAEAGILARSDPAAGRAAMTGPAQSAEPVRGEADAEFVHAISRLDPGDRALLALRHVAGLSTAELARTNRLSRPPVAVRLARLAVEVGGPPSASDPAMTERWLRERLLAYARVPVWPVDADAMARRARIAAARERTRLISVAISAVIAAIVATLPTIAMLLHGH
jgi:RNA polymerase sigma-70 factor (ECF subfamily)